MTEQVANTVTGNLNGALTDVATSATLVDASAFPSSGDFRLKVDDELILVTGVAGNVLTVTRGIEGTTAMAHADGRAAKMVLSAAALTTIISEAAPTGDTSWTAPTLLNSWVNYGSWGDAGYRKLSSGLVVLKGLVKSGSDPGVMFVLPSGYRPADASIFACDDAAGSGRIDVDASGNVSANGVDTAYVSLNNIRFYADGS